MYACDELGWRKENAHVAGDWDKEIAAGAAFALLEQAIGRDEFPETALKRPAVEFQAFGFTGLFELGDSQPGFVRSQQDSYFVELLPIDSFWHVGVATQIFATV